MHRVIGLPSTSTATSTVSSAFAGTTFGTPAAEGRSRSLFVLSVRDGSGDRSAPPAAEVCHRTGTKKHAQARLVELLRAANRGELVEPSKRTVGDWLMEWLEKAIKPPSKRPGTHRG